jgi:hypothetical protein
VQVDIPKPLSRMPDDSVELPAVPYNQIGFGIDSHRNTDTYGLDSYLNLPLVGTGKTYQNETLYDLETEPAPNLSLYKYLRFKVLESRSEGPTVEIGGITFLTKNYRHKDLILWDPNTGTTEPFNGSWKDNESHCSIFCFKTAQPITSYEIKTSFSDPKYDPSYWILEGSNNASYWVSLDTMDTDLPLKRGTSVLFDIQQ